VRDAAYIGLRAGSERSWRLRRSFLFPDVVEGPHLYNPRGGDPRGLDRRPRALLGREYAQAGGGDGAAGLPLDPRAGQGKGQARRLAADRTSSTRPRLSAADDRQVLPLESGANEGRVHT